MAGLFTGLLVIFICHFVEGQQVHSCIHEKCPTNSSCELYVNSAGLQGSCRINGVQWHSEHPEVPRCQLRHSLVQGNHCFCPRQFCVDYILHFYNGHHHTVASNKSVAPSVAPSVASTVAPLSCHGHYCVGNQVCLLTTNPKIPTTCGLRQSHPTCSTHQNPDVVCACDTQSCINNFQRLYRKDSHVNCGGTCHIHSNSVCIVAYNNSYHIFGKSSRISLSCVKANTAQEKASLPNRCTSTPSHRGQKCFCESQICVNSYGNVEPMDDHVDCGNTSCHVHRGMYCIVSRTGRLYHYRPHVSSTEQHCAHNNTESHKYPTCTTSLRIGQTCHCATQSCVNNFSIRTTSAPTTPTTKTTTKTTTTKTATTKTTAKTTASVPTTMMTTTITTTEAVPTTITTLPTTPKDYPECNGHNCNKYAEYCHLFMLGDTLKGSCVPFKVALECNTFEDLNGPGCTCSTTACFQEMVIGYNRHSTTNTPIITTQEVGFNCFGETCFPSKGFCHISQHNGGLHGNCVNSNDWPMCRSFADLTEYGCYCSSATCTETAVKMFALEVMFMTASSKSTSEATTTMQTTIQVKTTSSKTVTCFDKPGVDCDILNTTNICANILAARQYCAAYCDLCNLDGVPIVFG